MEASSAAKAGRIRCSCNHPAVPTDLDAPVSRILENSNQKASARSVFLRCSAGIGKKSHRCLRISGQSLGRNERATVGDENKGIYLDRLQLLYD
mmetsp:Transcript_7495/g.18417  ORF Transcript_7495/g.18417 Transcript_7495/m.18417 type:complete len:94 (-) Transcript_7495:249-530(-)